MALYGNFLYIEENLTRVLPFMQDGDWLRVWQVENSDLLWGLKIIKLDTTGSSWHHKYADEMEPVYDPCVPCEFLSLCDGPPCDHYTREMKKYTRRQQERQT